MPRPIMSRQSALTLFSLTALLALGGCTGGETDAPQTSLSSQTGSESKYGEQRESLAVIERLYKADTNNTAIATRYAKALRESGNALAARNVLAAVTGKPDASTLTFTELAALELEGGNFTAAESAARRAIKLDDKNYRVWHILGISLQSQEKYPEAQIAFEKALGLWQGDSIPVMNNLALNLAAQGQTDQALAMLQAAKEKDPERIEIERNIRIIRTLNEPAIYTPKPRS